MIFKLYVHDAVLIISLKYGMWLDSQSIAHGLFKLNNQRHIGKEKVRLSERRCKKSKFSGRSLGVS